MAAATPAELRTRLEQILDDINGLGLLAGTEQRLAASTLPVVKVGRPAMQRPSLAYGQRRVIRRYPVDVLVQSLPDSYSSAQRDTAFDLCETWQNTIARYLEARTRLERNDSGIAFGMDALELSNPGIEGYMDLPHVAGFVLTVPVISIDSV